ncbi:MAG: hypothetical protein ACREPR_26950, partial [Brasilonema sp.]
DLSDLHLSNEREAALVPEALRASPELSLGSQSPIGWAYMGDRPLGATNIRQLHLTRLCLCPTLRFPTSTSLIMLSGLTEPYCLIHSYPLL